MRFFGLAMADRVPDYSTIWRFSVPLPSAREALVTAGTMEELFAHFDATLTKRDHVALGGQLIDASIVEALRQRLTAEEKRRIRSGEWPAGLDGRQGAAQGHGRRPRWSPDHRSFRDRINRQQADDGG
jgi:hypothetical protein